MTRRTLAIRAARPIGADPSVASRCDSGARATIRHLLAPARLVSTAQGALQ